MLWDDVEQNAEGDEQRMWLVAVGDEDGEPISTIYKHRYFDPARDLAQQMSRDRGLPLERM